MREKHSRSTAYFRRAWRNTGGNSAKNNAHLNFIPACRIFILVCRLVSLLPHAYKQLAMLKAQRVTLAYSLLHTAWQRDLCLKQICANRLLRMRVSITYNYIIKYYGFRPQSDDELSGSGISD